MRTTRENVLPVGTFSIKKSQLRFHFFLFFSSLRNDKI